jgi:ABC-type nickel/cobalt efflux system permease component RcnA
MSGDLILLFASTGGIAFVHALLGPDHYLPFVALGKAHNWSNRKLAGITLGCGLAHTLGTVLLGVIGLGIGSSLKSMMSIESFRGDIAAWALLIIGFTYMVWGLKQASKNKPHSHWHVHADGSAHAHTHNHHTEHAHVHAAKTKTSAQGLLAYAPWSLFLIFIFGPCEPLIPLLMFSAESYGSMVTLSLVSVFTLITLGVMLAVVFALTKGLHFLPATSLQRFTHALSGGVIGLCGVGILAFGL